MSVFTKKGDTGKTRILNGIELSKAHIRIKSIANIDELNSYIGLIRSFEIIPKPIKNFLLEVQNDLFKISAMLACTTQKLYERIPKITSIDVEKLEIQIDRYEKLLPKQHFFIIPGGSQEISFIHISRSVCRRAETYVVELNDKEKIEPIIIKYINRLSDYLFVLARYTAKLQNIKEQRANVR